MVGILGAALMGLTGGAKGYAEADMKEQQDKRELAKSIVDTEMKMEYEARRQERLNKIGMAKEEFKHGLKRETQAQQSALRQEEISARGKETRLSKEESDARAMDRTRFQQEQANKRTGMTIADRQASRAMKQDSKGTTGGTGLTESQKLTRSGQLLSSNTRRLQSIDSQLSDPIKSRKMSESDKSALSQERSALMQDNQQLREMLSGAVGIKSRGVEVGNKNNDIKLDLEGIY